MSIEVTGTAVFVCMVGELVVDRGAAALVGGEQVALFRVADFEVLGVQQLDPFSGAHVMSRGIVGNRGDALTVASPMHKQVFDLRTGRCLDALGKPPRDLRVWPVRVGSEGQVLVEVPVEVLGEVAVDLAAVDRATEGAKRSRATGAATP